MSDLVPMVQHKQVSISMSTDQNHTLYLYIFHTDLSARVSLQFYTSLYFRDFTETIPTACSYVSLDKTEMMRHICLNHSESWDGKAVKHVPPLIQLLINYSVDSSALCEGVFNDLVKAFYLMKKGENRTQLTKCQEIK